MTKKKNQLNYGKIANKVLDVFADLLISTKVYPRLPSLYFVFGKTIKLLINKKKLNKLQAKKALYNLKKRKLISIVEEGDQVKVYLKEKYQIKVIKRSIKKIIEFKLKQKKWHGNWFIVFFDVPESEKNKRDYLRKYLKSLGFYQYQQSVYILPFSCKKEVELIKKIVDGAKYIKYIVAKEIEDEQKIKNYFNI